MQLLYPKSMLSVWWSSFASIWLALHGHGAHLDGWSPVRSTLWRSGRQGQSITVSVNMFVTFINAQIFLTLFCHMKFGLFYFFSGWVTVMTIFVALFLPETKNMPLDEMILVWKRHWFWGKFIADEDVHVGNIGMENGKP